MKLREARAAIVPLFQAQALDVLFNLAVAGSLGRQEEQGKRYENGGAVTRSRNGTFLGRILT